MTNWCYNRMKITGPISEISRFKQTCIVYENEQARLDFNAIDPMPDFFPITTHCRTTTLTRRSLIGG